ncbi:MAG: L-lactate dehydrogenase [Armatimonadota bacterium]|nr:MAG: L-lactate dehydrogenase [Armatimonadota bacterium]
MTEPRKVVIIGAGAVGSTFAYTLMQSGLAREIVLIDVDRERAQGEAMDLNHGLFFAPPVDIRAGDYDECADAALIVITAGAKQQPGESRLDLVQRNVAICKSIMAEITSRTDDAVIIMVTNPVDALTHVAQEVSGWPRQRIIGSGTVLDSARFRYLLSTHCRVDPRNVHAYVIGEHGDSEVACWSMTHIAGVSLREYCRQTCTRDCTDRDREQLFEQVRDSAYHVIESKGATYYGVSMALERIAGAVLRDENSVLTVSLRPEGSYGLRDVCLSLPAVVNRTGVERVIEADLTKSEQEALSHSAKILKDVIERIEL